ncbi:MAG: S8 family serine peptidase, partial [Lachnospiraceae bacterium]|nr:S8 family serine peptidase [Lachnospiraceae bacterium]
MEDQKLDNLLNLALDATDEEMEKSEELGIGYDRSGQNWEVIVRYGGTPQELLEALPETWEKVILSGGYAILTLPRNQIEALAAFPQIEYVEKPKRLYFSVSVGRSVSCLYPVQAEPLELYGAGVLVAVIDSGVDYFHPDFRKEDGTTRIAAIWDQSAAAPVSAAGNAAENVEREAPEDAARNMSGNEAEAIAEKTTGNAAENVSGASVMRLGRTPAGFSNGVEYTREEINEALAAGSREAGLALVPERDASGHGTEVLGIAAGNGRASGNPYRGVAPKSDILVVKLGTPRPDGFPSTTELMTALEYVMRKAEELSQPVAVNLSFGNVYGSHRGNSLLETYIDTLSKRGRNVIVAGTGNEGNTGGHFSGRLSREGETLPANLARTPIAFTDRTDRTDQTDTQAFLSAGESLNGSAPGTPEMVEFLINEFETTMNLQLWKNYADQFEITIVHPNGRRAGPFAEEIGTVRYHLGNTELLVWYGEPSPYQTQQEIYIDFIPGGDYIDSGIWQIVLTPLRIVAGGYSLWMPDARARNEGTRFLNSTPDTTMTIPSTASGVIAVGAYDARLDSFASFSGRGWPDTSYLNRPDLAAPGVDVTTTAAGGGYVSVSGTSFAAPFVTGAAALLMEWGLLRGNDPYLYGEKVRAYLHRGARQLPGFTQWPNNQVGYG